MKKQILKIAGVKSEKEFYKKFPTEEAFMKVHGKAFKKAQIGAYIGGEKDPGFQPIAFKDVYDQADYAVTGSTEDQRREEARRNAEVMAAKEIANNSSSSNIGNAFGQLGEAFQAAGSAKKGKDIPKYQTGPSTSGLISIPNPAQFAQSDATINKQFMDENTMEFGERQGDWAKQIGKFAPGTGKIIQGIQQLKEEKKALQRAEQMRDVSALSLQASRTRPEETQRRYLRPEQITNTGEEFFPIYGVGTNILARNGASVGGGEIANTFAPNTLYDDLGYEPMNDSERYKQFYHGGKMHKAQFGDFLESFSDAGGGDALSQMITGIGGENAGGNIGGQIGSIAGSFLPIPGGKMIGQVAGQLIGTALDRKPQKIKAAKEATQKNIQAMGLQSGIQGAQKQYTSFMKDGGMTTSDYEWVSHTWQPQKIVKFGEHNLKDLLRPPHDADMLRAGGHLKEYTSPSERAMSTERPMMQEGGELQTHWGGYAEPMSYNPYLPEGGETIMFRGQSHDESDGKGNTGIGITYGDNPVEVERGEPAIKLRDGSSGDSSLVVFGNLKIPHTLLGDPAAKGKNFKKYVAELSKGEEKQNKLINKSINTLDEIDVQTPYDRLKFNSLQANVMGGNMKLKDYAQKKMDASALQTAMNDTIEEFGLKTTDKGNVMAKLGKKIPSAQKGGKYPKEEAAEEVASASTAAPTSNIATPESSNMAQANTTTSAKVAPPIGTKERVNEIMALYNKAKEVNAKNPGKKNPYILELQKKYHEYFPDIAEKIILGASDVTSKARSKGIKSVEDLKKLPREIVLDTNLDEYFGPRTEQYIAALPKIDIPGGDLNIKRIEDVPPKTTTPATTIPIVPYKRNTVVDILGSLIPYVRPSDIEELDPIQLAGEMYAMATNQLEPVQAQLYRPQLSVPYDISLQDILNENEATFRSQQRMFGYNPALQSQLAAQKYSANQKVLGEQFRMNQAMKDQVYRENRDILNKAQLANLSILDKQYERQEMAKSKTKATTQAALNSVASKYAQNKLENRMLQTFENLYNYRFDPRFRAINMNAPFQPQIPTVYSGGELPVMDDSGTVVSSGQQQVAVAPAVGAAAAPVVSQQNLPSVPMQMLRTASQMKEEPSPFESGMFRTGGVKKSKKKQLNSSIVKALKNL